MGCSGINNYTEYLEKRKISDRVVGNDFLYVKSMLNQTDRVKKMLTGVTTPIQ
jgi:hypothetical protein